MIDSTTETLDGDGLYVDTPDSIRTYSGKVSPLAPTVDQINIEDVAHALSRQCRYNGHCVGFMSVARHSIWVAERLKEQGHGIDTQLNGLLHDAAEAYLGDLVRPLKRSAFGVQYLEAETVLETVIAERFGLPYPFPDVVYEADNYVLNELELYDRRFNYFGDYREDEADFMALYRELVTASVAS